MTAKLTLREIADLFNDLDAVDDPQEREARYQKLRQILQARMIISDVAVSRGKTAAFSDVKIGHLRLLQALIDSGFKGPVLWQFNAFLTGLSGMTKAGTGPGTAIAQAVEGIRNGEDWILTVRITRSLLSGELEFLGRLRRVDDLVLPRSRRSLDSGRVIYSEVSLPATALILPILEYLQSVTP